MRAAEMTQVAALSPEALSAPQDAARLSDVRRRVTELTARFPLYPGLLSELEGLEPALEAKIG